MFATPYVESLSSQMTRIPWVIRSHRLISVGYDNEELDLCGSVLFSILQSRTCPFKYQSAVRVKANYRYRLDNTILWQPFDQVEHLSRSTQLSFNRSSRSTTFQHFTDKFHQQLPNARWKSKRQIRNRNKGRIDSLSASLVLPVDGRNFRGAWRDSEAPERGQIAHYFFQLIRGNATALIHLEQTISWRVYVHLWMS